VLDAFVRAIPMLPFDEAAAREYAKLPFKRARFDRLLAAHALSLGATIITNNEGDFADVPGLKVENWIVERDS
jgi:tRNA(fMet)-specific endonuclease VapC